jgi:1,4-dihydroxy-6-naphthoate synthase
MLDGAPTRIHVPVVGDGASSETSSAPLKLAISTCPNDTFAFAALMEGRVPTDGLAFELELHDIDQLNQGLMTGRFDVAKCSFRAALALGGETVVLPVGSALGFGVGPLLLSRHAEDQLTNQDGKTQEMLTLCPGQWTTANWLFELFYSDQTRVEQVVFSRIMPDLVAGRADFGVCIHEGRFTYQESGLHRIADLGELWEAKTGCPLPLGGLVMRSRHDEALMRRVSGVISRSLAVARANPATALPAMRRYAQSMDDTVLMQHVDLYVNDWTVDLGDVGRDALAKMGQLTNRRGNSQERSSDLRVLD